MEGKGTLKRGRKTYVTNHIAIIILSVDAFSPQHHRRVRGLIYELKINFDVYYRTNMCVLSGRRVKGPFLYCILLHITSHKRTKK